MTSSDVHVTPDEFIDLAEGTRSEASHPHLAACAACRDQLATLRGTMTLAVDADVPEPSPLFWQKFSTRLGEQIDRIDAGSYRHPWLAWARPRVLVPLSAAAVLALVVAFTANPRRTPAPTTAATTAAATAITATATDSTSDAADLAADPLLALVSDLSANMDVDSASASGFAERDSAEHAVTHMSTDELRTLKQLLQAELTRSGA